MMKSSRLTVSKESDVLWLAEFSLEKRIRSFALLRMAISYFVGLAILEFVFLCKPWLTLEGQNPQTNFRLLPIATRDDLRNSGFVSPPMSLFVKHRRE